ncbi:MAG: SusC/RagA family TonB-linked outer membrane protein [Saprospiraceae bacterium]|nr:SusC/RagA family TonB-linked outer membrane protein [Saprospiraceae bacterium]
MKKSYLVFLATLWVATLMGQNVRGVVSSDTGEPLIGVSILEKGTSNGTITDIDGSYQLQLMDAGATLVFSYTGFQPQEIVVNGQTQINVVLVTGAMLDEIVVTGLGITRERKALGYAASIIDSKELEVTPITNFATALYGKAPGVSIRTVPGGATSGANINVRGFSSITGNTQPLIVLDGVPIRNGEYNNTDYWGDQRIRGNGLVDINMDDIENISVLKGASAAALYGSEAVNGVILLTSKKGKKGQGLGVEFNASYSADRIAYLPRYQNIRGPGYFTNLADAGQDEEGFIYYDVNKDGTPDTRGLINTSVNFGPLFDGQPIMAWDGIVRPYVASNASYADLFQNAHSSDINLAVTNGGERSTVRFSFTRQDNQMISFGSKNERNIANLTTSFTTNKHLSTVLNVKYINQYTKDRPYKVDRLINNFTGMMNTFEAADWYFNKYKTSLGYKFRTGTQASLTPDENIIYNGFKGDIADYVWRVNEQHSDEYSNRVIGNIQQRWTIIDGLELRGIIGTDLTNLNSANRNSTEQPSALYANPGGAFSMTNELNTLVYGDVLLSYDLNITPDLDLGLKAGYNARKEQYTRVNRSTNGGLSPENFFDISGSINTAGGSNDRSTRILDAVLGIASIGYKNFAYLEGTIRRDRTSTISPNNNSFVYPSVNASFLLSEAMQLPEAIRYAKLRASYGVVGNYPDIYRANIAYNQNTLGVQYDGGRPILYSNISGAFGNDLIRPEQKREFEIGLEGNLWGRLRADFSFYNGRIVDQILPVVLPRSSGAQTVLTNIGTLRNKGIEIQINGDIIAKPNFNWNATINYARNVNVVEKLANGATELLHSDFDGNAAQIRSVVGEPMGDIYAHPVATNAQGEKIVAPNGLYQLDGNVWEKYGNALPDFEGGILNELVYRNFVLNVVADFSVGGSIMPTGIYWLTSRGLTEESLNYMDAAHGGLQYYVDANGQGIQTSSDRGPNGEQVFNDGILLEGVSLSGEQNTNVISQAVYYNGTYNWGGPQYGNSRYELYINKNNWFKVREVALGYDIPGNLTAKAGMRDARISVFGRNLFFIYRSIKDLDPEQTTAGSRWYQNVNNAGNNPSFRTFGVELRTRF